MPIIAYLGEDITDYQANSAKYLETLHFYCPVHGVELIHHAKYNRHVKDFNADISIQRLCCPHQNCHYTISILPDFIQPYKHYSAKEIASVLIEAESEVEALAIDTEASISTVRRWISQYQPILDEKISQIKAVIFQTAKKIVNEASLLSNKPMGTLHKLLSLLPMIKRTSTLGGAFIYVNALAIPT
jgi:hypothetical protein